MLYAATIALSAFLLFVVQPTIAKQILPWFGGAASVWTTCMVFFQVLLLAGYSYSDALARRLSLRTQVIVHVLLLTVSLATLPIVAPVALKPQAGTEPSTRILILLGVTVGLPYFLLSTTGPLVQAWFAKRYAGDRVYRLYALSNVASIAALVAYPVVIEPFMSARSQAIAWSAAYAAYVVLTAAVAVSMWRRAPTPDGAHRREQTSTATENVGERAVSPRTWVVVFGLAALASVLLLAVTAHMTRDVASIPFLWIVPLLIYLLTFVICFDGRDWYRRKIFVPVAAALVVVMLATELFRDVDLRISLPVHGLGLFAACMLCHGEIVLRRPAPHLLTRFYLMISLGGAAGGLFVGIVAPHVFPANFELPLSLFAVALATYFATPGRLRVVGAAASLAAAALATLCLQSVRAGTLELSRNFYGSLRVTRVDGKGASDALLRLSHGVILHGQQFEAPERRRMPTAYFGPTSGIARTIALLRPKPIRMGIVGLGTGTLAAYGIRGDYVKFYELDPAVERVARTRFHFLEDSVADIEVTLGDARLTMEREAPQQFDLLVVDAFSSDSIPVHLMTREAMAVYAGHLSVGGAIAFHISNRYLDLGPVVRQLADAQGMRAFRIRDDPDGKPVFAASVWVIVTNAEALLKDLEKQGGEEVPPNTELQMWTDDYSNLLTVVDVRSDKFAQP